MIYLHLDEYGLAIHFLEDFNSSDPLLAPLALGGIGDAFAELDQLSDALNYYEKALSYARIKLLTHVTCVKPALLLYHLEIK